MSSLNYDKVAEVFHALGTPSRVKLLSYLSSGRVSQVDLVDKMGMRGGALYYHIYTLLRAGLIRKSGRGFYKLTPLGRRMLELIEELFVEGDNF